MAAIGAVDDGKSTVIGRLLHDAQMLTSDQVLALRQASPADGRPALNLSFATDGLRAEREQGITIDVAYRYALTARHKLVIADCPGHLEYTRNTATGASTADLALVVVDATRGLREQTRRHLAIAMTFGVRRLVVAVNKMDLVGWDREVFLEVAAEVTMLAERLGGARVAAVPISAAHGDHVVRRTKAGPWYSGQTLLGALEEAADGAAPPGPGARLAVQTALPGPDGGRRCAGRLSGGPLRRGDEVVVLPSGVRTRVLTLEAPSGPVEVAPPGLSLRVGLAGDPEVARGDLVANQDSAPHMWREAVTTVCWLAESPARATDRFAIKHTTLVTGAEVVAVEAALDLESLRLLPARELAANSIGRLRWRFDRPLAADPYSESRETGAFIAIDLRTNAPAGAAMLLSCDQQPGAQ